MALAGVAVMLQACLWVGGATAATLTWTGGAGTWNTTTSNWNASSVAWPSAGSDVALFNGTSGTVTISGSVGANGLTFDVAGYTIAGGTLTLTPSTPTVTTNQAATISSIIAGSSGLRKDGAGTLTLSGANSYTGGTTISSGTLVIASTASYAGTTTNNGALVWQLASGPDISTANGNAITGSGAIRIENSVWVVRYDSGGSLSSGTITIDGGGVTTPSLKLWNTNSGTVANSFVLNSMGSGATSGAINSDGAGGGYGAKTTTLSGQVTLAGNSRIGMGGNSQNRMEITGKVTGAGALYVYEWANAPASGVVDGLRLTNATNDYSGGTVIERGRLGITSLAAIGTGAVTVNDTNGQLLVMASGTMNNNLTLNGTGPTGSLPGDGSLNYNLNFGDLTLGGTVTLGSTSKIRSYSAGSTTTFAKLIAGSGNLTLEAGGAASTHTQTWVLGGSSASTYSGSTTVSTGNGSANAVLRLAGGTLPAATVVTLLSSTYSATLQCASVLDLNGNAQTIAGLQRSGATGLGTFVLNTSSTNAALTVNNAADFTYTGVIGKLTSAVSSTTGMTAGNDTIALTKSGAGLFTLSGANTYSLGTIITGGTLRVGSATALGSSAGSLAVNGGALDLFGNSVTVGVLSGSAAGRISTGTAAGTASLTTSLASGSSTFAGSIVDNGSGKVAITKGGAYQLTLSGSNGYTGSTTISGGRLEIASGGWINGTSGITINGSGAELKYNSATALTQPITFTQGTLSGTGTIGTAVTAGGNDILSPGNSPGSQSFTNGLTWDPAGTYLWEMNDATGGNGTGWDIINVSGGSGLTINATSGTTFNIAITSLSGTAAGNAANFSSTTSGSWTILSSASGITGFAAAKFTLDRSAFTNTSSGTFTLSQVASGTNQTLVLAYNTISALSSSTSSVTGFRVMQGLSTTTAVNLLNAGPDATGYSLSPSASLSLVSGSTGTLAASGTQVITFGYASTAATGARSGTVSFTNTGNSGDAGGSVSVSGAVVTNRVVTASAVDFGLVHLGASGTATSSFTSTGSDNDFTRITVGNGTGGGLTVSGSSGFVFNGSGGSSRSVAGTFATAGTLSGTIALTNTSAEAGGTLPGQVPGTTGLAYSASVFSGTATWNVAGGGAWDSGASSNWTSAGGVQAAPGTFAGYTNTDVAIFAGTQGGTSTVLLNGATPSLASLSFANTANRYVIDQGSGGSLTLATSSGKPTIDVNTGGLHEIKTAILGSAGLAKLGGGTLVLSGSNGFTGGTDVSVGTLAVNGSLGGAVNVASGAVLSGTGSLNGLVTVAGGGILAPGNSPGTLAMNAGLVLADASVLNFELSATDFTVGGGINDLINVNGTFTLDGILNVTGLGDFSTVANNTKWRLFNYDTGGTFTNNGLSLGMMPSVGASGKYFQIDTATAGQVNLVIVPEPGAACLICVGLTGAALAAARRRRGGR